MLAVDGGPAVFVPGNGGPELAEEICRTLSFSGSRSTLAVKINKHSWAVETDDGERLLLITRHMAKQIGRSAESIAREFSDRLTDLLQTPAIVFSHTSLPIVIPVGEFRSIKLGGLAAPRISIGDEASAITHSTYSAQSRVATILGVSAGSSSVDATADDGQGGVASVSIPVLVEPYAGQIQSTSSAHVSGQPVASQGLVLQATRNAIYRSASLYPGAYLEISRQPTVFGPLSNSNSVSTTTALRAVGHDMIPEQGTVSLTVSNDGSFQPHIAQSLFYSNNPETVRGPQTLFTATLPGFSSPARLVYHHINSSTTPLNLRIELVNTSAEPATVNVIRGDGGPDINPVTAGLKAGDQFLQAWQSNSGLFVDIPKESRLELLVARMPIGGVLSGIVEITQTAGHDKALVVRVAAEPYAPVDTQGFDSLVNTGDQFGAYLLLPLTSDFRSTLQQEGISNQVYTTPSLSIGGTYQVGASWLWLNIGTKDAIARKVGQLSLLDGNYGVIYNFDVGLYNPTSQPRVVTISFEAGAGFAAGLFKVDGLRVGVSPLPATDEQEIARYTLAAGETRHVQIQTMPLSGSAYPARICARAL